MCVCVLECLPDVSLLLERKRRGVRHSQKCARLECFFSVQAVVLALIHQPLIFADISRMFVDVDVLQGHSGETTANRSKQIVSGKPLPAPKCRKPTWVNHMFGSK